MKLLLHMCCAPCAVYPVSVLKNKGMEFEGFFYNPNIHPAEEFARRKENVGIFAGIEKINVHYMDDFMQKEWEEFGGTGEQRCGMCYSLRMDKAAEFAAMNGFDAFTTTLLVSPYQKHELIVSLGEKAAKKYGINFYYEDFRPGFRQGQQQAKDMGLYRQKFCGCIISLGESDYYKKKKGISGK